LSLDFSTVRSTFEQYHAGQAMKYYIENGKTGKMEPLLGDEIKRRLQAREVTWETPCLSEKGTWEMVRNIFTASEPERLGVPEMKPEDYVIPAQIWEADQQWPELQKLRANFEGKEAIWVGKGVFRVRISNIHCPGFRRSVHADVGEIYPPGLGFLAYPDGAPPNRWEVGGVLGNGIDDMRVSDDKWFSASQGGAWDLYFNPKMIQDVLDLAGQLSGKATFHEFYSKTLKFLMQKEYPFLSP
jgi:hypothetical protein